MKHQQNKTIERLEEFKEVKKKQQELEESIESVHDTLGAILAELQDIKTLQNENMYRIAEMTSFSKDIAVKTKRQLEEKPFGKLIDNLNRDTDSDDDEGEERIFSFKGSSKAAGKDKQNIKGTFVWNTSSADDFPLHVCDDQDMWYTFVDAIRVYSK